MNSIQQIEQLSSQRHSEHSQRTMSYQ